MNIEPTIRSMTRDEARTLIEWAAAEGWNPGLHDPDTFWECDPDGFVAIELDGTLVGGGSIVRHAPSFGFMGLFLVRPEFRGRGLGESLWIARRDRLRGRLDSDATIGMDAVVRMVPFYARGGFREHARGRRYRLDTGTIDPVDVSRTVDARCLPFEALADFDRACFPSPRERYLRLWLDQPEAHVLAVVEAGEIRGFGVSRPCRSGWKIAPLFASSPAIAEVLFTSLSNRARGEAIHMDVSEANPDAIALCERHGMNPVFDYVRMYLGPTPTFREEWVYSVTSLELG